MTNKNNHRAITIDQLPIPQSRVEEALHVIIGTQSIDTLPDPQSRIEVLLHYIALNGGTGGGGNITIDNVVGLRAELNKKGDSLKLDDNNLHLMNGIVELSSIPMTTTAEIQLILNNLN